jgi:hypothetical protein
MPAWTGFNSTATRSADPDAASHGWRERNTNERALTDLSEHLIWEMGVERTLGAARAVYLRLPETARLWVEVNQFEIANGRDIEAALAA